MQRPVKLEQITFITSILQTFIVTTMVRCIVYSSATFTVIVFGKLNLLHRFVVSTGGKLLLHI